MAVCAATAELIKTDGTTGWADSTHDVHTLLTFDSSGLVDGLRKDPSDSRATHLDFVWGADSWALTVLATASPNTRTSKYIPCCRDTSLPLFGAKAVANYTARGWGDRVLYRCDRKTPAYYANGGPGRASHTSIPLDFSNPNVIEWQAAEFARPAAALGYDALALDNVELENSWGACGVWRTPTQWVQLYNGSINDQAFEAAVASWLARLKSTVNAIKTRRGLPMKIIPNFSLHNFCWNDTAVLNVTNAVDGILTESGFIGGGYRGPTQPYDYVGNAWIQRIKFALNLQRQQKSYYSINAFGDHSGGKMKTPCSHDPHACITPAVREWVLASYLMGKDQASAVALYQLEAAIGAEHGYGNWSYWPEWTASVGTPTSLPVQSAAGLWSRNYSTGFIAVNPWTDRGTLQATLPIAPVGKEWRDLLGNTHQPGAKLLLEPTTGITLVLSGVRSDATISKMDDTVFQPANGTRRLKDKLSSVI